MQTIGLIILFILSVKTGSVPAQISVAVYITFIAVKRLHDLLKWNRARQERRAQEAERQANLIADRERKTAQAQSEIDFYEPLAKRYRTDLAELKQRQAFYNKVNRPGDAEKLQRQIDRLQMNIFKAEQKLEKAYFIADMTA